MSEPQQPKTTDEAGRKFHTELLRHFHQDPPDVPEDIEEAA